MVMTIESFRIDTCRFSRSMKLYLKICQQSSLRLNTFAAQ